MFDRESNFNNLLGFIPYWDYNSNNEWNGQKITTTNTIDKIRLNCDCVVEFVVKAVREPILFSFDLDEPPGYKIFCEPETPHYKKNRICFEHHINRLQVVEDINYHYPETMLLL